MPPSACGPNAEAHHHRRGHGQHPGQHHALQCGLGRDIDATGIVRLGGAFEQAGYLAELAPNLLDHVEGGVTHRGHGQRRDQEREDASEKQAGQHLRIAQIKVEAGHMQGRHPAHRP
jgi:hypothetical protein